MLYEVITLVQIEAVAAAVAGQGEQLALVVEVLDDAGAAGDVENALPRLELSCCEETPRRRSADRGDA